MADSNPNAGDGAADRNGPWHAVPRSGAVGADRADARIEREKRDDAAVAEGRGGAMVVPGADSAGAGHVTRGADRRRAGASGGSSAIEKPGRLGDPPGPGDAAAPAQWRSQPGEVADAANSKRDADGDGEDDLVADGEEEDVVLAVPLNRESGTAAEDATIPVAADGLEFADDGVKFDANSVLAFPDAGNVRGNAGSITFDVEPEWNGPDEGDHSLVNIRVPDRADNFLRVFKNGRYLRFMFADDTGQENGISVPIDDWNAGERRTITATWGDALTSLYIDDRLVGTNTYAGQFMVPPGTPMYVGSDVPKAPPTGAAATISNLWVFGRAIGRDEIGQRRSTR